MTSSRRERLLEHRLGDHRAAVREFIDRAGVLTNGDWMRPRAAGKWTPAQETRHLILAYDLFLTQLNGGPPLKVRTSGVRQAVARWIGLTSILYRKRIPVAVRAPREARPEWETAASTELLPELHERARTFDTDVGTRWRDAPATRLTHFIFGELTLDQAIQLMTVHTRHHAAFLPDRTTGPFRR
jgi:hypothetical protein